MGSSGAAPGQRAEACGSAQARRGIAAGLEDTSSAIVFLESPEGLVETGISMAAEITIRGYTALVLDGSGCHSICAIMWIAGVRRYMSADAAISVHAAYRMRNQANGGVETCESGMANAEIGAFLNEIGLSADAIRNLPSRVPVKNS